MNYCNAILKVKYYLSNCMRLKVVLCKEMIKYWMASVLMLRSSSKSLIQVLRAECSPNVPLLSGDTL